MRKVFTSSILLLIGGFAFSQKSVIDSLENELKTYQAGDTARLNTLIDLAFYLKDSDPQKGITDAKEAIQIAGKMNDQKKLSTAYNYTGLNYIAQGNDTVALYFFRKCLSIRNALGDQKGIGSVMHNMGTSYFNLSDYPNAMDYQTRALQIFKKLQSKTGLAVTYNSIGVLYLYLSDYPKALHNYLEALALYEKSDDEFNKAGCYINIGLVYDHLANYKESLNYQFKALQIAQKFDDLTNQQNALGNIGNTYDHMGNQVLALQYFKQAISINEKLKNNRGIASNLANMGIMYGRTGNYDSSMYCLNKAYSIYQVLRDKYGMSNTLSYLASGYVNAPATVLKIYNIRPEQRFSKAIALQSEGLQMAHEIRNLSTEADGWQNLSDIYEKQKNFTKAFESYKNYISIRDSITGQEKKNQITRLTMQFEFDKKEAGTKAENEKKQALASAQIKKQKLVKNTIATAAALLLLSAFLVFIFYKRKRDAEDLRKEAELKAEMAETEMKALRSQMNPHFIFNSLNSISDFILHNDVKKANYYLGKFAKMMRMILENSEHSQVTLADDLKALELYMQLEAVRLNDKFSFEIKVDEAIDQENTLVPPLILQPFVENSIWHGIAQKEGKGKILIEIKKENDLINCMVEDNGVGLPASNPVIKSKRSLGMKITRSRIEMMNKIKKSQGSVELFHLPIGTRVEVKLPLALDF